MGRPPIYGRGIMLEVRYLLAAVPGEWTLSDIVGAIPFAPARSVMLAVSTMARYSGYIYCCCPNVERVRTGVYRTSPALPHPNPYGFAASSHCGQRLRARRAHENSGEAWRNSCANDQNTPT